MSKPHTSRIINLESLRVTPPSGSEDIAARVASGRVAEMSLKHAGLDDEITIKEASTGKTITVFDPEAFLRARGWEPTSPTKPHDNEASPTETKMNYDNEANIANEANETEEKARLAQEALDAAYPTRLATQAEREEIYGVHSATTRDPHDLWICTPHGVPIPVMSSTKAHAQLMAQKALASLSKRG